MMQNLNNNFSKEGIMFTLPNGMKSGTGIISGNGGGAPTGYLP